MDLVPLTTHIDAYVDAREAMNCPLTGPEKRDYDWIVEKMDRLVVLKQEGRMFRFRVLYGLVHGRCEAFIKRWVSSESQR